ncbi:putative disease resistance protein [Senna tora]|uniref:Putative disease resistance protein n=1 Tax=Senna tora TaxID=362788 RepID=A0A834TNF3_9FABA|nr:putative disease resistance protein [Senna tora]
MATDSIVGDILLNVLQVAFNKLASSDFLDFFRARRLDETLQKLNVTLLSINAVINDAEKKQISEDVKAWLDAVKDAAYEAEDLLDEIDTELSKYKMEAEFQASTGKVRNIFSTASASSFDKDFESRMKKCLENLENMASEKDRLGLTEGVGAGLRMVVPNIRQSSSFLWKEGEAYNLPKMIRHFSYIRNSAEASKLLKAICEAKRLRTFLPLGRTDQDYFNMPSSVIHDLLSKLRRLRVLSFSDYSNITELPDSIGNLKHLRYLNLSGIGVKRLPDSICLLHNLQTLNLRYCVSLEKLPPDMHKLINLRNLDFSETNVREMPKQLGNLKNLQFLPSFLVGKYNETSIKQLGELNALETLSILELQNVVDPMEALEAKFKNKIHLEKLMLGWSTNDDRSFNEMHVLEKLQPHQNLKELSISNYGGIKFPFWFADNTLSNVVSLELINCKNCFFLPSLGLLPSLKSLSIIRFDTVEAIGPKFFGNSACTTPFVSLEILRFQEMVRWEEWECSDVSDAFPCLQELHIEKCPRLKEHLPAKLLSLRKLVIDECERLVASIPCAPTIQELVLRNCGKLQMEFIPPTLSNLVIMNCPQVESFLKARGVAIKSEAS